MSNFKLPKDKGPTLRDQLKEIDNSEDITVSSWEADFLQNVLYGHQANRVLSRGQQETARRMISKYLKG